MMKRHFRGITKKSIYRKALYKIEEILLKRVKVNIDKNQESLIKGLNNLDLIDDQCHTVYKWHFQKCDLLYNEIEYWYENPAFNKNPKENCVSSTTGDFIIFKIWFPWKDSSYLTHYLPFRTVEKKYGIWFYRIALRKIRQMIYDSYSREEKRKEKKEIKKLEKAMKKDNLDDSPFTEYDYNE